MKRLLAATFLTVAMVVITPMQVPAFADQQLPYQLAQAQYDMFVDSRGRRYLVDPETGEIVGRANRNRRMTRQEKRRAERALRRELRRDRIENELGSLFGMFRRDDRDDFAPRRQRRNSLRDEDGFYLDDYDRPRTKKRRKRKKALRQPKKRDPIFSEPLPEVTPQEEIARLPDVSEPVESTTSASVMPKPKYNQTRMASLQVFLDRQGFYPVR